MKSTVSFDWLTFTILGLGNEYETVISNFLKLNPALFSDNSYGMNGYKSSVSFNGIRVLYDGNYYEESGERRVYSMGVCVSMSGDACRAFEEIDPGYGIIHMLRYISGFDEDFVHFTRLDLACDDHDGALDIDTVKRHADNDDEFEHWVKGRFSTVSDNGSRSKGSDRKKAKSVYFGAPCSKRRIRFYDKAKEQGDFNSHWIRCEMVLRGDYANGAVKAILDCGDDVGGCVAGIIRDFLEFVEPTDANIGRCQIAQWWNDFLDGVAAVKVFVSRKAVHTWDKLDKWARFQLAPSLYAMRSMFGENYLNEIIDGNKYRVSKKNRMLMEEYFEVYGLQSEIWGQELIDGFWCSDDEGSGHRAGDERIVYEPERLLNLPTMTSFEEFRFKRLFPLPVGRKHRYYETPKTLWL
ncbi:Cro/Cl family transcriptional regulator [Clostridia bacterium]|nr:Cro/Cl family transcriptional regulator [Clostridia bacterium]